MKLFLPLVGMLLSASASHAEDALWFAAIAQGPIGGTVGGRPVVTWLEAQPRWAGSADNLLLRPAIGVQVSPSAQLLAGYMLADTYLANAPRRREHRTWQQALLRVAGTPGKAVLMSRTRLEQRFFEGFADDGWRLRQFLRGQLWLGDNSDNRALSVIGVSEAFVSFDSTSWGQRAGLEQWRNFVGLGVPLDDRLTLEAGYLNQRLIRPGADRSNHVLNINLFYRLG
jgi:hypothetical protein